MKLQVMIWQVVVLSALSLLTITLPAFNSNTFTRSSVTSPEAIFYNNPLLINNKTLNYADFSMASKGILTVVSGNPETTQIEKIPFRIYLRRNGESIDSGASDVTRSVLEIDLAPILAIAQAGDDLIIEPVRASDARAKRSIKLKPFFNSDLLFPFFLKRGDGC